MSTKKVFWDDPYLTTMNAKVTTVSDILITLDRTIAFAFSGGQASDCGSINGYSIFRAEKVNKEINISDTKARVDFVWNGNISEIFTFLYSEANRLIEMDLPIISEFSDEENEDRYWEIKGFGKVPCGGTHIRTTGEIGPIKLKRDNIGKGKERIEIVLVDP